MKAKKKPAKKVAKSPRKGRPTSPATALKGWQQISAFLSQPVSVAQRWAKDGMPLMRQGRFVTATPQELNKWLGRQISGEPVQVATADLDLSKELKRGLAFVRPEEALIWQPYTGELLGCSLRRQESITLCPAASRHQ